MVSLALGLQLAFTFMSASIQFQNQRKEQYKAEYLRFQPTKNSKVFKLKCSLYSSVLTVVPCKNSSYKLFLVDSLEFDELKGKIPLDIYIKLFLNNIVSH